MNPIKVITSIVVIIIAISVNKSCQDDTPSSQAINIVNKTNFIIDNVVIQSNTDHLVFQSILPDSSTTQKYGQDILTSLKFIIKINNIEIRSNWRLPLQMNRYSDGKTLKSGEYEFLISNIDIDETNNDHTAIITLSSASYFVE